jgi:N-carbamoylputrescine amidase
VERNGKRLNAGVAWEDGSPPREVHEKVYLPEENGFWEASWYSRGNLIFSPARVGKALVGFLICTELWAMDRALAYGKAGVHLIATPRATEKATVEKWLTGGRTAGIVSGAYSISSNRVDGAGLYGGSGWITDPDGMVLGVTSSRQPFLTVEVDLAKAEEARKTYPRYALD